MGRVKEALWADLLSAAVNLDAQDWEFGGRTFGFMVIEKERYDRLREAARQCFCHREPTDLGAVARGRRENGDSKG